jgi:GT2 family glycosyltransferase
MTYSRAGEPYLSADASQTPGLRWAQSAEGDRQQTSHSSTPNSVSVVIATFRRPHLLRDVVSPHLVDPAVVEVIIVDDGSEDETLMVCAGLASSSPKVMVVHQANAGEAAARARGAAMATGDVLLFLDDDVVTSDRVASGHLAIHRKASRAIVLLGYMPPRLHKPRRPGEFPPHVYGRNYERICRRYESDSSSVLLNLWGGHFSVGRASFLRADPVDATLAYHADRALGWSLLRAGLTGVFVRSLSSEHLYSRSPEQFFADCRRDGSQTTLASMAPPAARAGADAEVGVVARAALGLVGSTPSWLENALKRGISLAGWSKWWGMETLLARCLAALEIHAASVRATAAAQTPEAL